MIPQTAIWTSVSILVIAALIGGSIMSNKIRKDSPFADRNILSVGLNRPTLWLFYDSSEVNARSWADFGARSSHALNLPYLNLAYETIANHNGKAFNIKVLVGIEAVAEELGGWNQLPEPLQRPSLTLSPYHRAWIRAAILQRHGGLWVDPSVISLASFAPVCDVKTPVFFGTDQDVLVCGIEGTPTPDFRVIWSPQPNHPLFTAMEAATRRVVLEGGGGAAARSDDKWTFLEYTDKDVRVLPLAELARQGVNRKHLQAEDFLAGGSEGELHFAISSEAMYVAFPLDEIRRRRQFGWFLRLSETQILESDLVVSHLLKGALPHV